MEKRLRIIYGAILAKRLINKGFVVRDIRPNPKDERRTVFLFDDDEEVEKAVKEFINRRARNL